MQKDQRVPKILYIAGYGRSGSTVLDVLLGAHKRVVSVGELVYLGQEWQHEERTCACGATYEQCSFWADAVKDKDEAEELMRLSRSVEHRRALPRLLSGTLSGQLRGSYRDRMRRLFGYIAERGEADWVVDSSKTARHATGRFWALHHLAGLDVRVLHLVRDGRDVLQSVAEKGTNWAVEGYRKEKFLRAERTLIGWNLANGMTWGLGGALDENRYLRVHFESLLDSPESVLEKVGAFIEQDLSSVIDRVSSDKSFPVGHNVGGNRIRHKEAIRLHRKMKEKRRPWKGISLYHRFLFLVFGQWLNSFFGYEI